MQKEKQIIAFIEPSKFVALLGFLPKDYRINGVFLDNGNNLVYIQLNGENEVGAFNEDKAQKSSILLVSDNFNLNYSPKMPFKLVSHTHTKDAILDRLGSLPNFEGREKSIEEEKKGNKITPYQRIADLINKKDGVSFEDIYKSIETFKPICNAKLNFLHFCLDRNFKDAIIELEKLDPWKQEINEQLVILEALCEENYLEKSHNPILALTKTLNPIIDF